MGEPTPLAFNKRNGRRSETELRVGEDIKTKLSASVMKRNGV